MIPKQVKWLGNSRENIRDFPHDPRREAGYQLERVQAGKDPEDWKPMPTVGLGVKEIRVREGGAFRVIYVARFAEAVYGLQRRCTCCRGGVRVARLPEKGEQDAKARH